MFLRQLNYLVALDHFRHFSRAAAHCGVSQPALSTAIRQLEHELGVSIVLRRHRVLGLTPEGERVVAWARQSLAALDGLKQEAGFAHNVAGGSLSIGIMLPAMQIAPLLAESLRAAIPALHLEVTVASSAEVMHGLSEERFNLGLIYLDQQAAVPNTEEHTLYKEQHVLAAAPGVSLPGRTRCNWSQAAKLPLCLFDRSMKSRQIVDEAFEKAGVQKPDVQFETNALELLHAELKAGRLASILPIAALPPNSERQGLNIRRLEPSPEVPVGVIRLRKPLVSALMRCAWDTVTGLDLGSALVL
ncbi:lysR family transcriptional regulator [Acetobacter aceti NRIC 0242]|uniref:LysR family transcriptional regulator n=1 Tax=Acetobacter aceti NBRC 14818 TaxID=887700 RepID=A0AB33IA68_ACEAC|nr:LysR family transcriptional regulator [Acetobacter aceti]TCS35465.1 DNA-binding transcriptional LysR family regulator [Acetobacter aceti NBRC 14818]BCK75148.1 LysR family transcriptional regulator [Acetobacter aceti NBRC 14818]GAN57562.1 transcriptional regulator LysR [Acetobacter aceti NBRC 14818]GBO79334.1 lysR family transcriptional regulator [Acetobacter aceti NRIC 0242]